jgi:MYXO-CTERM domain-containing protein
LGLAPDRVLVVPPVVPTVLAALVALVALRPQRRRHSATR